MPCVHLRLSTVAFPEYPTGLATNRPAAYPPDSRRPGAGGRCPENRTSKPLVALATDAGGAGARPHTVCREPGPDAGFARRPHHTAGRRSRRVRGTVVGKDPAMPPQVDQSPEAPRTRGPLPVTVPLPDTGTRLITSHAN
ncbi:hypothetical protein GTS_00240 [Gandjariella thermophila]|uniref:Uncharacterized protein n=1 Tax=Gandjariella thermophila TaxID=1931992 RepID=A0A4D4IW28_9PSEU|nr:hypothetical protein GTS_00240 [Gandjariella thermophila]